MQSRVRKWVLGSEVLVAVVLGLLVAYGVNGMVAAGLVKATSMVVPAATPPAQAAKLGAEHEENLLVYNRNLFNQSAGEAPAEVVQSTQDLAQDGEMAVEDLPPELPAGVPIPSDLRVLLIGTQVAGDARYSLALLKPLDATNQDTLYRGVGSVALEDGVIVRIDRHRVYVRRQSYGNRLEYIDIDTTAQDLMARARPAEPRPNQRVSAAMPADVKADESAPPVAAPQRVASAGGLDPGAIESLGADTYGIPREMAEMVRDNPKLLQDPKFGQPPQIQPVYRGGVVNGFRVLQVQPGSIYAMLGVQNGDIIMDVNGQIVDNPQKALSFFDQLGPGQDVGVKVNRFGRHRTITYKMK